MTKKLLIFGIVLLMFVSFASALEYNGVTCSTDGDIYRHLSGADSGTGITYITINTISAADNQKFMVYIENLSWDTDANGNPGFSLEDGSGYISRTAENNANNWNYFSDTSWEDSGYACTQGDNYTIAQLFDYQRDKVNYTWWPGGVQNEKGIRDNTKDFEKIGIQTESGNVYWSAAAVWNCTDTECNCPTDTPPPPPVDPQLQITAFSLQNNYSISKFNVTVNGSTFTTTNGTVNTNETVGWYHNFTIESAYFIKTIQEENNTFQAYLDPINFTDMSLNVSIHKYRVDNVINFSFSFTNVTNESVNTTYHITNVNDTVFNTTTETSYTFETEDFLDLLNITAEVCSNFLCQNSSSTLIAEELIDQLFTFNVTSSYTLNSLASVDMRFLEDSKNYTSNPITILASDFLSSSNKSKNVTIQIDDLNNLHLSANFSELLNESTILYNMQLDAHDLILNFTQLGGYINTSGYIADEEKSWNFTNASLIAVQQNLTEGYVHIRFGQTSVGNNHTQFYEYINDNTNEIFEDIEILQTNTWYAYFQVLDYTNSPIKDAIIRLEFSLPSSNDPDWTYHKLLGQRLTADDGFTFFWADPSSEVRATISKSGYDSVELLLTIGDESFTRADPIQIYLQEETSSIDDQAWLYINKRFDNRSLDMYGTLFEPNSEGTVVEVITDYKLVSGGSRYDISSSRDDLERYTFQLYSGIDFGDTGTANVTLYTYIDNKLWRTNLIEYISTDKQNIFSNSDLSILNKTYLNPILFILLLLVSFAISTLIKDKEISPTIFKVGVVVISFISTTFMFVTLIILIGYILELGIRRLIEE